MEQAMEMHQVRYFLAVARSGNFTRAAEECHISQPSLTRAIKMLEGELGNDLFYRERPGVVLTELGERMHPILKQCFDSALRARSVAKAMKKGERGSLKLALSHSVAPGQIAAYLAQLRRVSESIDVKLMRGTADEALDMLKSGKAELAVASTTDETWERFEHWPLFEEGFHLLAHRDHPLANRGAVEIADVGRAPVLRRLRAHACGHRDPGGRRDRALGRLRGRLGSRHGCASGGQPRRCCRAVQHDGQRPDRACADQRP
jgi:DNA-binding transcriptional LysR family regulator